MLRLFLSVLIVCLSFGDSNAQRGFGADSYGGGLADQLMGDSGKRKVALVVGVSNYSSESLRLKYADRDARLFRDYLAEVRKFPGPNIFFLPDSLATAGKIYNLVLSMMEVLMPGDELVIYFAGHGDVQKINRPGSSFSEAFLLAWDASGSRNYKGAGGVVAIKELQEYTESLAIDQQVKVSMVLDACHSGFDLYKDGLIKAQETIAAQFPSVNKWTGCAINELSYEADSIKHGLFTWYLVQGLMGLADEPMNNAITPEELSLYVRQKVSQASFGKQTPQMSMVSDFRYTVTPEDREKALAYFRNRQFNQSFASRGSGNASDTGRRRELLPFIDRYNRFLQQERFYEGDSSALQVIAEVSALSVPEAKSLESGLKNHLAEVLETRSQLVLNEFLKGKSQLPPSRRFYRAGIESALADSLLEQKDPRKKSNQVMSAFHKAYSYVKYEQYEKYDEADSLLRYAISLEPAAAYLYVALAKLQEERQRYDSAIYFSNKAAEIIPTWTHPQNQLGNQYEALYRYDEAIDQFQKTLKIDSNYAWSYNNLGMAYKNMGRLAEAEYYFRRSLSMKDKTRGESIERDLAISYNNLGSIYDDREQFSQAESYYKQAFQTDSTFTLPLRNLSELFSNYNGVEAEYLLKKSIQIMPYEGTNYRFLADFYRNYPNRQGILDSAAQLYQKGIELDPYDPWSYIGMAWLVKDKNKSDSGLQWLRKGMQWASTNPDLLDGLAQYFEQTGVRDSAHYYFRKATEINPFDFNINQHYADFILAEGDTLAAEKLMLSQTDRLFNTPKYFYQLGDFYYGIGQISKAIDAYRRVVSIDSLYAPGWEALAYLYLDLGQVEQSLLQLKQLEKREGYDDIKLAYLYRVGELSLLRSGTAKGKWLEKFSVVDPNSQYLSALRLEFAYPNMNLLQGLFRSGISLLDRSEYYSDEWLKWLLLAAIELSDYRNSNRLAQLYLDQVIFAEPSIRVVALQLSGNRSAAVQEKSTIKKTDLSAFGPQFQKLFKSL
jgi:tetratricopeptide (TPR) repeat protein